MPKAKRTKNKAQVKLKKSNLLNFFIVFIIFGVIGGIYLYLSTQAAGTYVTDPQHRAACIENSPSKTIVRPGEVFTARVRIQNVGSSTFSGAFGTLLGEFRDGPEVWNASGKELSSNIPPGGIATFNLTARAPSTPGVYPFEWAMGIVFKGFIPTACTGKTVQVINPPSVSLKANGQGNISLQRGSGLTLNWSSTNSPTRCVASGNWGGDKPGSGSESRTGDTSTTGTKTYTLACSNGVGSGSDTRQVTITSPPAPPTSSGGSGSSSGGGGGGGSTSSGGSRPTPTPAAPPSGGSTSTPPNPATPTEPPTTPTNFSASIKNDTTVELTWTKPEFNGVLAGYELERSQNQQDWQKVQEQVIENETYSDTVVGFETKYYYRIRAVDYSDNKSEYASTEITTPPFTANFISDEVTITSEDGKLSVRIPKEAIDGDAQCSLRNNNAILPPEIGRFENAAGPYEVLCKTKDGNIIESFNSPLAVTYKTEDLNYASLSYFAYGEDWQEIQGQYSDNVGFFEIKDQTSFTIMGKVKSTPLIVRVVIVLAIIATLIFGSLFGFYMYSRYKLNKSAKNKYDDYYRKEHGY